MLPWRPIDVNFEPNSRGAGRQTQRAAGPALALVAGFRDGRSALAAIIGQLILGLQSKWAARTYPKKRPNTQIRPKPRAHGRPSNTPLHTPKTPEPPKTSWSQTSSQSMPS